MSRPDATAPLWDTKSHQQNFYLLTTIMSFIMFVVWVVLEHTASMVDGRYRYLSQSKQELILCKIEDHYKIF